MAPNLEYAAFRRFPMRSGGPDRRSRPGSRTARWSPTSDKQRRLRWDVCRDPGTPRADGRTTADAAVLSNAKRRSADRLRVRCYHRFGCGSNDVRANTNVPRTRTTFRRPNLGYAAFRHLPMRLEAGCDDHARAPARHDVVSGWQACEERAVAGCTATVECEGRVCSDNLRRASRVARGSQVLS